MASPLSNDRRAILQAFWLGGMRSDVDTLALPPTQYQQGFNILNHGGVLQTRPRMRRCIADATFRRAQGITFFQPTGDLLPQLVFAVGGIIYRSGYPYRYIEPVDGLRFWPHARQISFAVGIRNAKVLGDGTLRITKPKAFLMMADGCSRVGAWSGGSAGKHLNPAPPYFGPPAGNVVFWTNNRLAVATGTQLHLSDLANPLEFTEERVENGGGSFNFPSEITALGETPDRSSLLVFTANETYTLQTSIFDRTQWFSTPGFQKRLLPNIGCVAPKSFVNQLGVSWWYSAGGLVGLDAALNTTRSSSIAFQDQAMKRSRDFLNPDRRGVCCGLHDNYLLCSVPHADQFNTHTWCLDDDAGNGRAWAGIWTGVRPAQWASASIQGQTRTFALCEDWPNGSSVWEAFTDARADDDTHVVPCAVETSVFMGQLELTRMLFAELEFVGIVGEVSVDVYFAGRTGGGYLKIGATQRFTAPVGPFAEGGPVAPNSDVTAYRPQSRLVRTASFDPRSALVPPRATCLESPPGTVVGTDKGFTLYILWRGVAGLRRVTVFLDPRAETTEGAPARTDASGAAQTSLNVADLAIEPAYQLY